MAAKNQRAAWAPGKTLARASRILPCLPPPSRQTRRVFLILGVIIKPGALLKSGQTHGCSGAANDIWIILINRSSILWKVAPGVSGATPRLLSHYRASLTILQSDLIRCPLSSWWEAAPVPVNSPILNILRKYGKVSFGNKFNERVLQLLAPRYVYADEDFPSFTPVYVLRVGVLAVSGSSRRRTASGSAYLITLNTDLCLPLAPRTRVGSIELNRCQNFCALSFLKDLDSVFPLFLSGCTCPFSGTRQASL
ncbi:hypothetical protein J6590_037200 [Homalodisca vitripennis]|nr:hypothetical protein J6590_037200 [Homalodisca vitripennis]